MGRARDNISSSRSREDIDRDDEARRRVQELKLQMLGAFDPVRYKAVVDELATIGLDRKTVKKTRTQALLGYGRLAGGLVGDGASVNIDARRTVIYDAQSFLREESAPDPLPYTTGCGPVIGGASDPALPPVGQGLDDPSLGEAVPTRVSAPDGGLSSCAQSGDAQSPPPAPPAPTEPTETLDGATGLDAKEPA